MLHTRLVRLAVTAVVAALLLSPVATPAQGLSDENIYEYFPQTLGSLEGVFDGRVLYVSDVINSTAKTSVRGRFPSTAYATIDEAINRVAELRTAGTLAATDLVEIRVLPGHTGSEAVVDANLFDADIPNLYIRGYGTGTQRPKLTLSDDGAELVFDAANITFENFIVEQGVTALAQAISVTASADNLTLKDIEFTKSGTLATDTVDWINVAAGADDLTLDGITANYATTGTPSVTLVEFAGANARPTFRNFVVSATFSDAVVDGDGIWTNAFVDLDSFRTSTASTVFARTAGFTEAHLIGGEVWNYLENGVADLTGFDAAVTEDVWTVTGDVELKLWNRVGTAITAGTVDGEFVFGVTGDPDALIGATEVAVLTAGVYWNAATGLLIADDPVIKTFIHGGLNVVFLIDGTVTTDDPTAGSLEFYCYWRALPDGGHVAAATIASGA